MPQTLLRTTRHQWSKNEVWEAFEAVVLYKVANGGGAILDDIQAANPLDRKDLWRRARNLRRETAVTIAFVTPELASQ
jgi:hypothetical protein